MTGKQNHHSADFKAKVAPKALRGELTTARLARVDLKLGRPGSRPSRIAARSPSHTRPVMSAKTGRWRYRCTRRSPADAAPRRSRDAPGHRG
jgi:hypothetical protein